MKILNPSKYIKLSYLVVVFGFLSVYLSQVLYQFLPVIKLPLLLIFIMGTLILIAVRKSNLEIKVFLICCLISSSLLIFGGLSGSEGSISNLSKMFFYFTIMQGLFFSYYFEFYKKLLKYFVVINLFAMIYEFLTISYILEPTADLDVFIGRAKGVISYSKEAGSFILLFTILFIKELKVKWFPVLLFYAILTGSRLAILGVFASIAIEAFSRAKIKGALSFKAIVASAIFILIISLGLYFYYISAQSEIIVNRLSGALDTGHSSNLERVNFWIQHLAAYNDFKWWGLILGEPGRATGIVGNGAESAYLNLLTDGGIIALSVYLGGIFLLFILRGPSISWLFVLLLLVLSMQISRVNIGFLDGTMFWAYFWYLFQEKHLKKKKTLNNTPSDFKVYT